MLMHKTFGVPPQLRGACLLQRVTREQDNEEDLLLYDEPPVPTPGKGVA